MRLSEPSEESVVAAISVPQMGVILSLQPVLPRTQDLCFSRTHYNGLSARMSLIATRSVLDAHHRKLKREAETMRTLSCAAILFDLDGVLVESRAAVERQWALWAREHHLDPAQVIRVAHGRPSVRSRPISTPAPKPGPWNSAK